MKFETVDYDQFCILKIDPYDSGIIFLLTQTFYILLTSF